MTPAERAAMQRRANGAGLLGFLEPAMTVGSGIAAQAISGAAALPTLFMGNDDRSGVDTYVDAQRKMQDSMTYQPRSPEGQEGLLYAADKMAPVGSAIEAGQRYLGDREMNSLPDNAPVWAKAAAGTFGYMIPDLLGVGLGTGPLLRAASNVSRKAGVPEFGADVAPFKKPGFEKELGATAWHGSPHEWDKVDLDKIGTGEGAQAYGHGFYSAESRDVAKGYREALTEPFLVDGKPISNMTSDYAEMTLLNSNFDIDKAVSASQGHLRDLDLSTKMGQIKNKGISKGLDKLKGIKERDSIKPQSGALYELDVDDKSIDTMLDWDAPLNEQEGLLGRLESGSPGISDAGARYVEIQDKLSTLDGQGLLDSPEWDKLVQESRSIRDAHPDLGRTGGEFYRQMAFGNEPTMAASRGQEAASGLLNDAGIKGIKYFDGNSRGANEGTRNYVNFNADDVNVVSRNGDPIPDEGLLGTAKAEDGGFSADDGLLGERLLGSSSKVENMLTKDGRVMRKVNIGRLKDEGWKDITDSSMGANVMQSHRDLQKYGSKEAVDAAKAADYDAKKLADARTLQDDSYKMQHTAPMLDDNPSLANVNDSFPDIYTDNALQYYGTGMNYDYKAIQVIHAMKDKPNRKVKMYRAVPKDVKEINAGDWVTTTKEYARDHTEGEEGWHIISQDAKASQLATDGNSIHEFGYDPQ